MIDAEDLEHFEHVKMMKRRKIGEHNHIWKFIKEEYLRERTLFEYNLLYGYRWSKYKYFACYYTCVVCGDEFIEEEKRLIIELPLEDKKNNI